MGFEKKKIKQIRGLMVLAAALILVLRYSDNLFYGITLIFGISKPFLYGGAIAFVLNLPMRGIENGLLKKWKGRAANRIKRPVSLTLSVVLVGLLISLVAAMVVPQVTATAAELGNKIPAFIENVIKELDRLTSNYPWLQEEIDKLYSLEINWQTLINNLIEFLRSGVGSMLTSTMNVASSIIGGVVNLVVAFIFAMYILLQKEKLGNQIRRILSAYLPEKTHGFVTYLISLLNRNFSNFISGQCLEAVILGTMFVLFMSIFRMPYAVLVGILIAFTALIPIVGAFIGCFVGAFLIMIDNPMQAVWFVVLFLVLQQLEGNLIYPKVVGNSVGLPSIWVLMAVSVGGSLFGIVGMLFFIPLVSTIYVLLRDSVNNRNTRKGIAVGDNGGITEAGEDEREAYHENEKPIESGIEKLTERGSEKPIEKGIER